VINRKLYSALLGLLVLALLLFGWALSSQMQVRKLEKTEVALHYEFEYKQVEHNLTLNIPLSNYLYYKERPRPSWINYSAMASHPYHYFAEYIPMAIDSNDDHLVNSIVDYLDGVALADALSDRDRAELALTFVQSLTYTGDNVTTSFNEYPRYPVETLFDREGDCEDTSILLAAILTEMGYDVALLLFEEFDHIGLGINFPPEYQMYGNSWIYDDGRRYWYLDTTGGKAIGWCPEPYDETSAYVYPVGG
jgi:hypothetical protein